jgi:hypothetical protein
MAKSGVAMYDQSPENNVSTGKLNMNNNCIFIQCLNIGREVGRLHHELSLANEILKLLKKDMDLIQRDAEGHVVA